MVRSQADSFDFSAQHPPQDLPTRGILYFSVWVASTEPTKLTPHTRTGTMVSTSSAAAPAAASKVTNPPTLPTKSSSSACCVGLSFYGRPTPIDGWLLVVAANHPSPTQMSLRASPPAPGHHRRPPPCDHRHHSC